MQDCGFSESQYSFCFVFEYIQKDHFPYVILPFHKPFPFFTDTVNEGKFYGFDVCVGNYFFQFKRSNLYDVGDSPQRFYDSVKSNYFKIEIDTDAKQFSLLKRISNLNGRFNKVLYVTPKFHTKNDIKNYFAMHGIIENSALFSVNDFPASIIGNHYLVYKSGDDFGLLFSDPVKIPTADLKIDLERNLANKLSILEMAMKIQKEVLTPDTVNQGDNNPESFVRRVWATLLAEYDIHWYPVISPRLLLEEINEKL